MSALRRPVAVIVVPSLLFLCAGISAQRSLDPAVRLVIRAPAAGSPVTLEAARPGRRLHRHRTARPSSAQLPGSELVIADVNGDGAVDFFVAAFLAEADNAFFLNDSSGRFARQESFPPKSEEGAFCNAAAFGDVDADGDLDLVLANGITSGHDGSPVPQRNELLLGDGEGGFTVSEAFLADDFSNAPAVSRGVAVGDLDGDGGLDLVIGNAGENLLLFGDGTGGFESYPERWPEASDSTYGVALEDIDLDGVLDIVYANTAFNPFAQAILVNQGGAQEGAPGEFEVGSFPMPAEGQSAVRLGLLTCDVDADGDTDVLFGVHEFGAGERPDLYLNQGGLQGGRRGDVRSRRVARGGSGSVRGPRLRGSRRRRRRRPALPSQRDLRARDESRPHVRPAE